MTEDEDRTCTVCADEACSCHEICGHCNNWSSLCSCLEDAQDIEQEMRKGMKDD